MVTYDRVPPPYTQAKFNALLADFENWANGFTPSGTFVNPATYTVSKSGADTAASNAYQTIYGGAGDAGGVDGADSQAVIQAAINDCASGGLIFIRGANYTLDADLDISTCSNLMLAGEGRGYARLLNHGITKNSDATIRYNNVIRDLTIDIQNTANANAINIVENSYGFRIINCELRNTNNRFLLHWGGVDNLIVEDCVFYDGGLGGSGADNAAGTQLKTTENTSIFRNNLFIKEHSIGGGCLTTGATGNVLFEGNCFVTAAGTSYAAISIENFFGTCKDIQVLNNRAYGFGIAVGNNSTNQIDYVKVADNIMIGDSIGGSITVLKAKEAVIANNIVKDSVYGIMASYCDDVVISDNVVKNTNILGSVSPYDKGGFYAMYNDITKVDNNIVVDDASTTPYGIYCRGGDIHITNNVFKGPFVTKGIAIAGATDFLQLAGNRIVGGLSGLASVTTKDIHDNVGFVTETWGKATGDSPITVNHGLDPSLSTNNISIVATAQDNLATICTIWNESVTQFKIYHDKGNSLNVYWHAKWVP